MGRISDSTLASGKCCAPSHVGAARLERPFDRFRAVGASSECPREGKLLVLLQLAPACKRLSLCETSIEVLPDSG